MLASNLEQLILSRSNADLAAETLGDINETPEKLREILRGASWSDIDKAFFMKRIVEPYANLTENHKGFVSKIVNGLSSGQDTAALKGEILNYMMIHSGVSTWCVPLKKLVESM